MSSSKASVVVAASVLALTACTPQYLSEVDEDELEEAAEASEPEPSEGRVQVQYDKYKKLYSYELLEMTLVAQNGGTSGEFQLFASAKNPDIVPRFVALQFLTEVTESWRYLDCHQWDFLADGEPVGTTMKARHDGDTLRGGVTEALRIEMKTSEFEKLAGAESAQFRICNDEYVFQEAQLETLKRYRNRFGEAKEEP